MTSTWTGGGGGGSVSTTTSAVGWGGGGGGGAGGGNECVDAGNILAAGIAGKLDAAGDIDTEGTYFCDGMGDIGGSEAAGEPDGEGEAGADEAGGAVEIDEDAGAAEGAEDGGIDEDGVGVAGGGGLSEAKGFPERAGGGGLGAEGWGFLAVELDDVEICAGDEDFFDGGVDHDGDFERAGGERGEEGSDVVDADVTLGAGEEVEAEGVGAGIDGGEGIVAICDAADFYAEGGVQSMTLPFACLMPSWRVITRTLTRPSSERMKALRIQLTREMMIAPKKAWPKEST